MAGQITFTSSSSSAPLLRRLIVHSAIPHRISTPMLFRINVSFSRPWLQLRKICDDLFEEEEEEEELILTGMIVDGIRMNSPSFGRRRLLNHQLMTSQHSIALRSRLITGIEAERSESVSSFRSSVACSPSRRRRRRCRRRRCRRAVEISATSFPVRRTSLRSTATVNS